MTTRAQDTPTSVQPRRAAEDATIRPFQFQAPEEALVDLRRQSSALTGRAPSGWAGGPLAAIGIL